MPLIESVLVHAHVHCTAQTYTISFIRWLYDTLGGRFRNIILSFTPTLIARNKGLMLTHTGLWLLVAVCILSTE